MRTEAPWQNLLKFPDTTKHRVEDKKLIKCKIWTPSCQFWMKHARQSFVGWGFVQLQDNLLPGPGDKSQNYDTWVLTLNLIDSRSGELSQIWSINLRTSSTCIKNACRHEHSCKNFTKTFVGNRSISEWTKRQVFYWFLGRQCRMMKATSAYDGAFHWKMVLQIYHNLQHVLEQVFGSLA